ncbi:MAG: DUF1845 family protein [Nitrosomonas sp.]|nr:DUF1845 family protein [Nitrosomonas sp.]
MANAKAAKQPQGTQAKQDNPANSRPFIVQNKPLHSFHAQQLFKRGFDIYANAIYSLSVILRAVGSEDDVREIEGAMDERMNHLFNDLMAECARLEKMAQANGIESNGIDYSNPITIEAKITSPRAARYIGAICEFDKMTARLDALWLAGMIPDKEYSRSIYEWKRRILKLSNSAHGLSKQAMIAVHKVEVKNNEQTDEQTGQEQHELKTAASASDMVSNVAATEEKEKTGYPGNTSLFGWMKKQTG